MGSEQAPFTFRCPGGVPLRSGRRVSAERRPVVDRRPAGDDHERERARTGPQSHFAAGSALGVRNRPDHCRVRSIHSIPFHVMPLLK